VRVKGRLGQQHQDLTETIFYTALQSHWRRDGRLQILVDPYKVRHGLGVAGQTSHEQVWITLREVMGAVIGWRYGDVDGMGHIIDEVETAKVEGQNPLHPAYVATREPLHWRTPPQKSRTLWRVTIGAAWARLVRDDIGRYYDPRPIVALKNGVSQAVARLMLTHTRGTSEVLIDTALAQVKAGGRIRDRRREIEEDREGLAECGVMIDGGIVRY
jgi:hypothetical protein